VLSPTLPTSLTLIWMLLAGALALLVPIGLTSLLVGAARGKKAAHMALLAFVAVVLGVAGYFAAGFALHFGGVAGALPTLGELAPLGREWAPLLGRLGPGWGLLGLDGFFLIGASYDPGVYTLFFFQAALLAVAVVIPMGALAGRVRLTILAGYALFFSILVYPLFGNWAWGGGWLSQLGSTRQLGHGFVDFAGAGVVNAVGGLAALAGAVVFRTKNKESASIRVDLHPLPTQAPLVLLGALAILVGWLGIAGGSALGASDSRLAVILVNTLVAAACGAAGALLYMGFTTGQADALMAARGLVAGLVAVSAAAAFVPAAAAAFIGAVAGVLLCLASFVVERWLALDDPGGVIATHGVSGLWGLLALGLLADGSYGAGWNGVGASEYLGVLGQGVTGLFPSAGFQADTTQIVAQLVGILALAVVAFGLSWLFFRVLRAIWSLHPVPEVEMAGLAVAEPAPANQLPEE
jgi:Amt family ammonium transporter